jgi:hypothetical protein
MKNTNIVAHATRAFSVPDTNNDGAFRPVSSNDGPSTDRSTSKRQFEEGNESIRDFPSLKRICQIYTFSIDNDESEAMGANNVGDDDAKASPIASSNETTSPSIKPLLLTTDFVETRATSTENGHSQCSAWSLNNSRSWENKENVATIRYIVGCPPPTMTSEPSHCVDCLASSIDDKDPDLPSPPPSPTNPHSSIITPDEAEVMVQSPKWNMELHWCPDYPNIDDDGLLALKPKLSKPPCAGQFAEQLPSGATAEEPELPIQPPETELQDQPRLQGTFPEAMKPIIRNLIYLEETSTDPQVVQEAFDIVQNCCDRHVGSGNNIRLLTGSIFESLVEHLGSKVDLPSIFQASQNFESPKLDAYLTKPKVDTTPALKPFFPTLLQLAIAYGAHASKMRPEIDDIERFVREGAKLLGSMSVAEKVDFWQSSVGE